MITGTYSVGRVTEKSVCRSSSDYRFTEIGIYKIHSTALMPNIPFGEASVEAQSVDNSIFLNSGDNKLNFHSSVKCQNFLSTRYIGRAPLEWYSGSQMTKRGRQFVLVCKEGNPNASYRVFGTEGAIDGYNRNANENVSLPGGGD